MRSRTFQDRKNRDKAYRELIRRGVPKHRLWRRSYRNQQLHPMYVEDWNGGPPDTGIGNSQYKTLFPVTYTLEVALF